jgi:hypothetical protein
VEPFYESHRPHISLVLTIALELIDFQSFVWQHHSTNHTFSTETKNQLAS